jgi:hypothetical protein
VFGDNAAFAIRFAKLVLWFSKVMLHCRCQREPYIHTKAKQWSTLPFRIRRVPGPVRHTAHVSDAFICRCIRIHERVDRSARTVPLAQVQCLCSSVNVRIRYAAAERIPGKVILRIILIPASQEVAWHGMHDEVLVLDQRVDSLTLATPLQASPGARRPPRELCL